MYNGTTSAIFIASGKVPVANDKLHNLQSTSARILQSFLSSTLLMLSYPELFFAGSLCIILTISCSQIERGFRSISP